MRGFLFQEGDNVIVNMWHFGRWSAWDGVVPQHFFTLLSRNASPEALLNVIIHYLGSANWRRHSSCLDQNRHPLHHLRGHPSYQNQWGKFVIHLVVSLLPWDALEVVEVLRGMKSGLSPSTLLSHCE